MHDFINRPQIEFLSVTEGDRRRYWLDDDKLGIVEESLIGPCRAAATARRHSICRSLLSTWWCQYRNGELGSSGAVSFAPVIVTQAPVSQTNSVNPSLASGCQVEFALPNGRRVIVRVGVDTKSSPHPVGGGRIMIAFPAGVKVWTAGGVTELRRGMPPGLIVTAALGLAGSDLATPEISKTNLKRFT